MGGIYQEIRRTRKHYNEYPLFISYRDMNPLYRKMKTYQVILNILLVTTLQEQILVVFPEKEMIPRSPRSVRSLLEPPKSQVPYRVKFVLFFNLHISLTRLCLKGSYLIP